MPRSSAGITAAGPIGVVLNNCLNWHVGVLVSSRMIHRFRKLSDAFRLNNHCFKWRCARET